MADVMKEQERCGGKPGEPNERWIAAGGGWHSSANCVLRSVAVCTPCPGCPDCRQEQPALSATQKLRNIEAFVAESERIDPLPEQPAQPSKEAEDAAEEITEQLKESVKKALKKKMSPETELDFVQWLTEIIQRAISTATAAQAARIEELEMMVALRDAEISSLHTGATGWIEVCVKSQVRAILEAAQVDGITLPDGTRCPCEKEGT